MDVRIIGLGNVQMGDDGVGPYVIRMLEAAYTFPPDVTLVDAGLPGLDPAPILADADVVILVGALRSPEAPGVVKVYDKGVVMRQAAPKPGMVDSGVKQTLCTLDFAGRAPREVLLVGVVPQWVATCAHLSDAVKRAVPCVVEQVLHELARLGVPACARKAPHLPEIWWEAAPAGV